MNFLKSGLKHQLLKSTDSAHMLIHSNPVHHPQSSS